MRARLLYALTVTLVLAVAGGCGGSAEDEASVEESTAERTTEVTAEETTTREKTSAKERTVREKTAREKASKEKASKEKASKEKASKEKASKEKTAANRKTRESSAEKASPSQQEEGAGSSSGSVQSVESGADDEPQEGASAEEGANVVDAYSPEVASVDEPAPSTPPEAQYSSSSPDWRTPSQKAGFNEAGQDVSNTPVISPEENAARLPCLRDYYESLPEDQRGPESQRVTAEANAQGVTPFDIVGC